VGSKYSPEVFDIGEFEFIDDIITKIDNRVKIIFYG
jgi:hypothetical protein